MLYSDFVRILKRLRASFPGSIDPETVQLDEWVRTCDQIPGSDEIAGSEREKLENKLVAQILRMNRRIHDTHGRLYNMASIICGAWDVVRRDYEPAVVPEQATQLPSEPMQAGTLAMVRGVAVVRPLLPSKRYVDARSCVLGEVLAPDATPQVSESMTRYFGAHAWRVAAWGGKIPEPGRRIAPDSKIGVARDGSMFFLGGESGPDGGAVAGRVFGGMLGGRDG